MAQKSSPALLMEKIIEFFVSAFITRLVVVGGEPALICAAMKNTRSADVRAKSRFNGEPLANN